MVTSQELTGLREKHIDYFALNGKRYCSDGYVWPCPTIRLLDALDDTTRQLHEALARIESLEEQVYNYRRGWTTSQAKLTKIRAVLEGEV
jgi:hypothetical protein